MKRLIVGLLCIPALAGAADPPDMTQQKIWSEAEKDAFYQWLQEQHSEEDPTESQAIGQQTFESEQHVPGTLSNSYFSTRFGTYSLNALSLVAPSAATEGAADGADTTAAGGKNRADGFLLGGDLQYGRPITTWFRQIYNLGLYRGSLDQKVAGGPDLAESFWLYRAGYHLEMALVPLGLDQTRNILLRGGVDLFYGRAVDHLLEGADQQALQQALFDPVEGLQGGLSWSLGYEKQLGENFWRLHAMLDGFRAFQLSRDNDQDDLRGLGAFVGLSKVF